jgi:hypothetical protein
MTKNNDQSHSLYNIELVQDITLETAANYSGGAARINDGNGDPDVILFENSLFNISNPFSGDRLNLNASIGDGFSNIGFKDGQGGGGSTGFNDNSAAIVIERGRWQFFSDAGFKGKSSEILGPGEYDLASLASTIGRDEITSALRIG